MITIQSTGAGEAVFTDKVFVFDYTDSCMLPGGAGLPAGIDFGNVTVSSGPQTTVNTDSLSFACCSSGASNFEVTAPSVPGPGGGAPLVTVTKEDPGPTWLITYNNLGVLGPQSTTLTVQRPGTCEQLSIFVTGTSIPLDAGVVDAGSSDAGIPPDSGGS
jgi:hypothetical protein